MGPVDRENRVWRIPASTSKSKRVRSVPLNDSALEVLGQVDTEGEFDHVFVNRETGKPYTTIVKVWSRLTGRGRVTASAAARSSPSVRVLPGQQWADAVRGAADPGHSDPKVTERYAHLSSKTLQDAANSASVKIRGATGARVGCPGGTRAGASATLPRGGPRLDRGGARRGRGWPPPSRPRRASPGGRFRGPRGGAPAAGTFSGTSGLRGEDQTYKAHAVSLRWISIPPSGALEPANTLTVVNVETRRSNHCRPWFEDRVGPSGHGAAQTPGRRPGNEQPATALIPERALLELTLRSAEQSNRSFEDVFILGTKYGIPPEILTRLDDVWQLTPKGGR